MAWNASVSNLSIQRRALSAESVPALKKMFALDELPLGPSNVSFELHDVPTAVANAIRRVLTDEMPARALHVPADGFDTEQTTEQYMLPQFVNERIGLLPLRLQIPDDIASELELELDVKNPTELSVSIYAGDLHVAAGRMPAPLFNPTFELCTLSPGTRIVIRRIRVATGLGRDNAAFILARHAVARPVDIPEFDRAETHALDAPHADNSGFRVSCLVANPRRHRVTLTFPATSANPAEVRATLADACSTILDRIRAVGAVIERGAGGTGGTGGTAGASASGAQFTVLRLEAGLSEGQLLVPGETYTVGELLRRAVHDLIPNVAYVVYLVEQNTLKFTIRHSDDVQRALLKCVRMCAETFEKIQQGLR